MEKHVLLHIKAPLQSWGGSCFSAKHRVTRRHPTYGCILGLIGCCMGERLKENRNLTALFIENMSVDTYCKKQGSILRDFQTCGTNVPVRSRKSVVTYDGSYYKDEKKCPGFVYDKDYLSDAEFYVVLRISGEDLFTKVSESLQKPYWTPFFGRKNCIPSTDIFVDSSIEYEDLQKSIGSYEYSVKQVDSKERTSFLRDVPFIDWSGYSERSVLESDACNI